MLGSFSVSQRICRTVLLEQNRTGPGRAPFGGTRLAQELGEDSDLLLAMAGKVSGPSDYPAPADCSLIRCTRFRAARFETEIGKTQFPSQEDSAMIELKNEQLIFRFPEVHKDAE